ncbi:BUD13 homolog isoform X2 [Cinclus cinclus]|uniref:BUD13 homolog isoform X2 n=1 Tax=Cinclus cinclus TaxID=127875 RepID=UPI002E159AAB
MGFLLGALQGRVSSPWIKAAHSLCTRVSQGPARWFCAPEKLLERVRGPGVAGFEWLCQEWEFCLLVSSQCLLWCVQVAEFIDERPEEVKLMEEFRTNSKWKLLGGGATTPQSPHPQPGNTTAPRTSLLQGGSVMTPLTHPLPGDNVTARQTCHLRKGSVVIPQIFQLPGVDNVMTPLTHHLPGGSVMTPRICHLPGDSVTTPRICHLPGDSVTTPRICHLPGDSVTTPRICHLPGDSVTTPRICHLPGDSVTTPRICHLPGDSVTTPRICHLPGDSVTTHQICHLPGDSVTTPRICHLPGDSVTTHRICHLLGDSVMTHQICHLPGGSVTTPRICHLPGDSVMTHQICHLPGGSVRICHLGEGSRGPRVAKRAEGKTSPAQKEQHRSRSPPGSPRKANVMSSGAKAGLVSADVLQREKQELRKHERSIKHLEEESQNAQTVFRDKSGRKRNLAQEQLEQRQKAEAEAKREEQYAKWGKGLAQERQQQQNVEDAFKEMQKPLARYIDDQDLDRMLREQEREGDPMAALIKKRKAKENKEKEKPRYKGPAPPLNRFNIWPGHRWDGVDRSNGFEQQRFARIANKKAVQELAYKWSVEDM